MRRHFAGSVRDIINPDVTNLLTRRCSLGGVQAQNVVTESVPLSPAPSIQTGCPTVTETREQCSTCFVPACIIISTVTNSPECPRAVPTAYLDFPCNDDENDDGSECAGLGCTTTFTIVDYPVGHDDTTISPEPTLSSVSGTPSTGSNSTASTPEPPHSSVGENAAGRMAIPFAGWF